MNYNTKKDKRIMCPYALNMQKKEIETTTEEVTFTDYDTVKWGSAIELTTNEFFDTFEKMINDEKIYDTKVELDNGMLTFKVRETNKLYKISLDEREINNIKNGIPSRNTRILLTLFDHEKQLHSQNEEKEEINKHNEKLLEEARKGNIVNDQAKKLYISELEEKLKKNKKAKIKEIFNNLLNEWNESPAKIVFGVLFTLNAILTSLIIKSFAYVHYLLILPTIINSNIITTVIKKSLPVIKETKKENELIKHKIDSLKSMSVPVEVVKIKHEKRDNALDVNNMAKGLTRLIEKLPENETEEYANKLLAILEQYQLEIKSLKKEGLVLYTEDTLKNKYLIKLMEFEEIVNKKLSDSNKIKEYNNTLKQIEALANPKKKVKTRKQENSH